MFYAFLYKRQKLFLSPIIICSTSSFVFSKIVLHTLSSHTDYVFEIFYFPPVTLWQFLLNILPNTVSLNVLNIFNLIGTYSDKLSKYSNSKTNRGSVSLLDLLISSLLPIRAIRMRYKSFTPFPFI